MTGRQKMEAAFSKEGTPEIPVAIPYEGIFIRDHWSELTSCPWWYAMSPDIEHQMLLCRDIIGKIGQDWIRPASCRSREDREHMRIEPRSDGVFLIDDRTGEEKALEEPRVSGWTASGGTQSVTPERLPETPEEIDDKIYIHPPIDREEFEASGRADLASRMLDEFGHLYPISHVNAPLWSCYGLWGFEGMMTLIATRPDLVEHACERLLHKVVARMSEGVAVGAACIWIEDCFTDMVSPEAFEALNVRFLRQLVDEIHAWGMKSIYYYCGNPAGKWDSILSIGADALSLEEGKKGFEIDIADVVDRVNGRCAVLGNLDAVGVLQNGTDEELRAEISRQIEAGRRNGSQFVMSLGSPVTPDTPIERVHLYCDLAREFGTGE